MFKRGNLHLRCLGLLCGLLLSACGSQHSQSVSALHPGAFPALPSPGELDTRSPSFTEQGLMREAADHELLLPNANSTAQGSDLHLSPSYNPGSGNAAQLAYAVYSFDVENYDRDLSLRLSWTAAPPPGAAWIAFANYASNRWDWSALPANNIAPFTPLAAYTGPAPGYRLYAVVLLTGTTTAVLDRLRIGAQPMPGDPSAVLSATPDSGNTPLDVDFDGSGSTAMPPAGIIKYEFDFGEGAGFLDYGLVSAAQHQYTQAGVYSAQLRVTDVFGAQDTASATVTVTTLPPYDEVEPNDIIAQANALPSFRVADFTGSAGSGPGYPGYDGDSDDYFSFLLSPGETVDAELLLNDGTGNLDLVLRDADGDFLTASTGSGPREYIFHALQAGDSMPLCLHVLCISGYSDYSLTVQRDPPQPDLQPTPPQGETPLSVDLDASASSDALPGSIVKFEFDPLSDGNWADNGLNPVYNFVYQVPGNYTARLRVTDNQGNISYASAGITGLDPYGEVEPNNAPGQASDLPAFPFAAFRGSNGSGPGYPGYDGGDFDYLRFGGNSGQTVSFELNYDQSSGLMMIQIFDNNGSNLAMATDGDANGVINLSYVLGSAGNDDGEPYSLSVFTVDGHYGDYFVSGQLN